MENKVIKEMLQNRYNKIAFTDKYILGFVLNHVVYMIICDRETVDGLTCVGKASRGQGYALRFRPNKSQKLFLLGLGATAICSDKMFNAVMAETKYNRGEIFEKLVTEYFGQEWKKDSIPFTEAGDIEVNGIAYQIKFQEATFTNEKRLASLEKKA